MPPRLALICVLFVSSIANAAFAQRAVRPYFLLIVDTSGSMNDSVTPGPTCAGYPATKIGHAKCALTKIINATGDADFGLMQFSKASNNTDCNNVSTCDPVPAAAWLRVPIETNSWQDILPLIDNNGAGPGAELCAGGNTPLGGVLSAATQYWASGFGGFQPPTVGDTGLSCRPLSVILLTDGDECCGNCSNIISANPSWQGCPNAHAATGITCATGCSSAPTCANNFFESAPELAYQMLTGSMVPSAAGTISKRIPTYAIGFGLSPGDLHIEHIATAGGTDNPSDGPGGIHGFYASNESELSKAMTQIIADAQPPVEICNNADDDCDTLIDEGIPKYCDIPHGILDKTLCDPPAETVCDGKDDNCNGLIDEGLHNACGTCGPVPVEVCDNLDNDCDGNIDEDTGSGGACGTDVGTCKSGDLQCIGGISQCTGGIGPQPEICNCKDDDCDTFVDEDTNGNLCPDGMCVGCACVPHCLPGKEFNPTCPEGLRTDFQPSGECLCVKDDCNAAMCAASMQTRDGEIACAPDDPNVATCLCRAGMCVARCDGVSCASGQICNKHNGRCVANDCTGLGCASGDLCDPVSVKCMMDPCTGVTCKADEACRMGNCEKSCATIACRDGQRCQAGGCVKDACAGVSCKQGETCNAGDGKCIADACSSGKTCGAGLVCTPASGDCDPDPCLGVHCPAKQTCSAGECSLRSGSGVLTSHGSGSDPNARVVAAGGGGCSCRVTGGPGSRGGTGLAVAFGLGLLLALRRRRTSGGVLLALGLVVAGWPLAGCRVDPFCIDCHDSGHTMTDSDGGGKPAAADAAAHDSGRPRADAALDAGNDAAADSSTPRCKDPVPETCNGKDDDCDFKVDEDTVASVNDCDQHGICAGTMPICRNGAFSCRYPDEREKEETLCDGKDNDCDGRVDETFKTLNDACDLGVGACKVTGKQVCNANADGVQCEATTTIAPVDEVCDGIDNDCDGLVDEPRSNPGSAPGFVVDDVVQVSSSLWAYKYEASRPDGTSTDQGIIGNRACSRAGVLPWTNLTYPEALAACQAAGMELCKLADWVATCQGGNSCVLSYTPNGSCSKGDPPSPAYPKDRTACNGHDLMAAAGTPDTDALSPTGSYAKCFTDVQGGQVFDLSGNAKEWTTGPDSPGTNPLRGGSYNNLPGGMRCDFDFNLGSDTVRLPNVGFRCCSATQP